MVDAIYIDNNRVQVVKNNDIAFDSERPSVVLYPDDARIVRNGQQIVFPSPIQRRAYYRDQSGTSLTRCELWSTFFWQEWGPGESYHNENYFPGNPGASTPGPTTRNLPSITLGSVPAGTDYIDVRIKLSRTGMPDDMFNSEPPICMFPQGVWITSPGGSFPTEYFFPLARLFEIVLSGTTVLLNRYQSVANGNSPLAPGGYSQADININQSGWRSDGGAAGTNINSDGTSSASLFPYSNVYLAGLIDLKPYDTDGNKRPNGGNPCSGGWPDFTSTFTADIIVTPGRHFPGT